MHFQSLHSRLSSSCSWDSITVLWSKLADLKWFVQIINQRGGQLTNVFKGKDINFQKLGIGGLDDEFKDIFRRAFASRVFPSHIISKWGQHLVLYIDDPCTVACLTSLAFQLKKAIGDQPPSERLSIHCSQIGLLSESRVVNTSDISLMTLRCASVDGCSYTPKLRIM